MVHDHWFTGQMQEDDGFARWAREVHLATYPPPPRDRSWPPTQRPGGTGGTPAGERYDHPVAFTQDQLATYLLTQSNLQTVIERGDQTED